MTTHLSSQEFVDALEGGLEAGRQRHLSVCAECQTQVEGLRAVMADVETDLDTPDPSPLFWDHFQSRVHAAVREEAAAAHAASPWWQALVGGGALRTWLTAGATVAAVAMVAMIYTRDSATVPVTDPALAANTSLEDVVVPSDPALVIGGAQWEFVSGILATLDEDDVRKVLTPTEAAVDAAFGSLSEEERRRFLRLLQAEMVAGLE
jgi:hypothetical protein